MIIYFHEQNKWAVMTIYFPEHKNDHKKERKCIYYAQHLSDRNKTKPLNPFSSTKSLILSTFNLILKH